MIKKHKISFEKKNEDKKKQLDAKHSTYIRHKK